MSEIHYFLSLSALVRHHWAFCCMTKRKPPAPTTCSASHCGFHNGNAGYSPACLFAALASFSLSLTHPSSRIWVILQCQFNIRAKFIWELISIIQVRGREKFRYPKSFHWFLFSQPQCELKREQPRFTVTISLKWVFLTEESVGFGWGGLFWLCWVAHLMT